MRQVTVALCLFFFTQVFGAAFFGVRGGAETADGLHFVVFHNNATSAQKNHFKRRWMREQRIKRTSMTVHQIGDFHAISSKFTEKQIDRLLKEDAVEFVEPNYKMSTSAGTCNVEKNIGTWGLERLNDRKVAAYDYTYKYSDDAAQVDAYILDTGIDIDHPQFEGRAKWGFNGVDSQDTDCNGHGTHVAGTVGALTYGVAKKVSLTAVKFLGCGGSGTNAGMIKGMEYIAAQAASRKKPSVVNCSAGGPKSETVNKAMSAAVKAGVTYVVAAGNEGQDACNTSPASCPDAIVVGATDIKDAFAYFSNYGTCVSILAPGVNITSTWLNGGTNAISGTSMACPHVAGVVALTLGNNPTFTPKQAEDYIVKQSTVDSITEVPDQTVNKMPYVTCDN